ncbi:helix-turn-helix domain-containing protein [Xanthobacter sp. DSM 24535]|uniref:helix-turn-helix domain-containing protein n=1 Tax=Roseixanthobacter psychrophilus TaxID=3119917 RepID=UPI0037285B59
MTSIILRKIASPLPGDPDTIVIALGPCCIIRGQRIAHLSPIRLRLAMLLLGANGQVVSRADLFDAMYGEREDGGPFEKIIDINLVPVRRALKPLGVSVVTRWGRGLETIINPIANTSAGWVLPVSVGVGAKDQIGLRRGDRHTCQSDQPTQAFEQVPV